MDSRISDRELIVREFNKRIDKFISSIWDETMKEFKKDFVDPENYFGEGEYHD